MLFSIFTMIIYFIIEGNDSLTYLMKSMNTEKEADGSTFVLEIFLIHMVRIGVLPTSSQLTNFIQ